MVGRHRGALVTNKLRFVFAKEKVTNDLYAAVRPPHAGGGHGYTGGGKGGGGKYRMFFRQYIS